MTDREFLYWLLGVLQSGDKPGFTTPSLVEAVQRQLATGAPPKPAPVVPHNMTPGAR